MVDLAGNTLQKARGVLLSATAKTLRDTIGGRDVDFFKFRLQSRSSLNVQLKNLRINADLELAQDLNRNGKIDAGEIVASSRARGASVDSISIVGLDAGTYFLRVFPRANQSTTYSLSLSARPTNKVSFAYSVVKLTNEYRQANGLLPLAMNTQLNRASYNHSRSMALDDFFAHEGLNGSLPWDRMRSAGYDYVRAAENIAAGYAGPTGVLKGWINSPPHNANLLNSGVTEMGVGFFNLANDPGKLGYSSYWTQGFATPTS